jgi:hypothetical protein
MHLDSATWNSLQESVRRGDGPIDLKRALHNAVAALQMRLISVVRVRVTCPYMSTRSI